MDLAEALADDDGYQWLDAYAVLVRGEEECSDRVPLLVRLEHTGDG